MTNQLVALIEERAQLVEAIRTHKLQWSQLTAAYMKPRKKIPLEVVEAARAKKADLVAKLALVDGEIGYHAKQNLDAQYGALAAGHERYASYFLLIARTELKPAQLAKIEKAATKMLAIALRSGIEKCAASPTKTER